MLSDSGRVGVGSAGEVGGLLSSEGTLLCDVLSGVCGVCDGVLSACCPVEPPTTVDVADT